MTRLANIESHIASMSELLDIVGAMRSLAGMRMQEAQRALPGIRLYAQSVARGLADTLRLLGELEPAREERGRLALILCMSEHGFVGGFNEKLLEILQTALTPGDSLFILGSRGAAVAAEHGQAPLWSCPMPTRCAAAPQSVQHLSTELYRLIGQGEIQRVDVIYVRHVPTRSAVIERRQLLPLDLTSLAVLEPRQPPLHNLEPVVLHERLLAEYVFALLTEATVESVAGENAARLAAMESARDNVSRKLEQLTQRARQARQDEITAELLELVTGSHPMG